MSALIPPSRPRLSSAELDALLAPFAIDRHLHPLLVVGIRGYYRQSMGDPGENDRGLYDDALFLTSPNVFAAFNGNTDPTAENRTGLASLKPGAYYVHRFDKHRGQYLALCQRAGEVIVKRDNTEHFARGVSNEWGYHLGEGFWKGEFGINIHRGAETHTSSLGCQTIPPLQWEGFIALAISEAKRLFGDRWQKTTVPYVLLG